MNGRINLLLKDSGTKYFLLLCIVFIIAQIILTGFFYSKLPPLIPFFNSLPWGTERLSPPLFIFAVPAGVIIILLLNIYISTRIYLKHALIARILMVNVFLISLLGLMAIAQMLLLIF